jgi:hypothetical protein
LDVYSFLPSETNPHLPPRDGDFLLQFI